MRRHGQLAMPQCDGLVDPRLLPAVAMTSAFIRSLYVAEEQRLRGYFRRNLPAGHIDVSDAVHDTFLRMLAVPNVAAIANPQAYLFQVAKSVAHLARWRAVRMGQAVPYDPEDIECDLPGQERIVAAREELLLLAAAIEALPNRCQQVFILSRIHGLANGDIASRLGISRNMVEKHVIRALLHCRAVRAGFGR